MMYDSWLIFILKDLSNYLFEKKNQIYIEAVSEIVLKSTLIKYIYH